MKLKFTVPDGVPYGTNTPEYLKATLTTTTRMPEPTSMLLLPLGVAVLSAAERQKLKEDRSRAGVFFWGRASSCPLFAPCRRQSAVRIPNVLADSLASPAGQ